VNILHVGKQYALLARARHVGEGEAIERFVGVDFVSLDEDRNIGDTDIRELVIANGRDAVETGDGSGVLQAAVQDVDTKEPEFGVRDLEIVHSDVFDERTASWAALDIDGVGARSKALAVFDEDVAYAGGSFAADADACPYCIVEGTVGDANVFAGNADGVPFHAAPALERDAVVARFEGAAIDDDVLAGVDVDAVSAAVDGDVLERDVFAVDRMGRRMMSWRATLVGPSEGGRGVPAGGRL